MLVIDTFFEWFIIIIGVLMAIAVIWPRPFECGVKKLTDTIAKWLRDHGM